MANLPDSLLEVLRNSKNIAALTGAGISAESGVPTFRDAQTGLWSKFNPQELATPGAFLKNPKLVWEWYDYRRKSVQDASPNAGHVALARLESMFPQFTLITQNIDGLHQRAGSRSVVELHGNIHRVKCFTEGTQVREWDGASGVPPRCPRCGSFLRPDVVWFEEPMPQHETELAFKAAEKCDVFLLIGTSAVVYPAAMLPISALENGATLVEVNPSPTAITDRADYVLSGPAGEVLPRIVEALEG